MYFLPKSSDTLWGPAVPDLLPGDSPEGPDRPGRHLGWDSVPGQLWAVSHTAAVMTRTEDKGQFCPL